MMAGCSGAVAPEATHEPATSAQPPQADTPPAQAAPSLDADVATLVADNNAYVFDTYARLRGTTQGNISFAPYSLSMALAMTYAGAQGKTASQIAQALHFSLPPARLHPAFAALDAALTKNAGGSLAIANSLWGSQSVTVNAPFEDILAKDYASRLQRLDFGTAPDAARDTINAWVSDATQGRLPSLLPQGSIDG